MNKNYVNNKYYSLAGLPCAELELANEAHNQIIARGLYNQGDDPSVKFAPYAQLVSLMNRILRKKPHWTFRATVGNLYGIARDADGGTLFLREFDIFDGGEELGFIRWGRQNGWGKEGFEYDNFRLNSARARNRASFSTKENVVANRVVKMFYSKTPIEVIDEATDKANNAVGNARSKHHYAVQSAYRDIQTDVYDYIANNWEAVQPLIGGRATGIDLPALIQAKNDANRLSESKNTWVVVSQSNGRYIARRSSDVIGTLQTFTNADLPPRLRMGLGLLNMVDEGEMIPNVGIRAENGTFYIVEEETNV